MNPEHWYVLFMNFDGEPLMIGTPDCERANEVAVGVVEKDHGHSVHISAPWMRKEQHDNPTGT